MKIYRIVATGPMLYNYPIDVAYAYNASGYKVGETHYKWKPVSGGYALLAQKEISYSSTGALTATVISNVTTPVTYAVTESPAVSATMASLLDEISCYFTPQVAYAQEKGKAPIQPYMVPRPGSACGGRAGVLAINTGTLAVESAFGVLEVVMIPVYIGTWVSWTYSLYDYLNCLSEPPRCTPSTCTGGGGSTW
jgi:hypothetical protein